MKAKNPSQETKDIINEFSKNYKFKDWIVPHYKIKTNFKTRKSLAQATPKKGHGIEEQQTIVIPSEF